MVYVHERTNFVTGLPENMGGSGDPSPVTAYGVYMGMKASAHEKWGDDSLKGKRIAVQGVGHVGENLVRYISEEGAKVFITDINKEQLEEVSKKFCAEIVSTEAIYDLDVDIYAPCALGATLNTDHIGRLKCAIVAGAANNQLADEIVHGKMITEKGILYAPDFLINAGGLINVYSEIKGYDRGASLEKAKNIYTTTLEIFRKAKTENMTTAAAARMIAEERLAAAKEV
jgi:leucine dehydrogenase